MAASKAVRSKGWCLTINNYTAADLLTVSAEVTTYTMCGKEKGENGTPHLQVYLHYKNQRTFLSMKKKFPRAHIEKARGTGEDNKKYCSKEGEWTETGEVPASGTRSDIAGLVELTTMLREGSTMTELMEVGGDNYIRNKRKIEEMANAMDNDENIAKKKQSLDKGKLRQWQLDAMDRLDNQNDRQILFVVDTEGGQGKSYLGDWITFFRHGIMFNTTTYSACAYAYKNHEYVVFDLTRTNVEHINYGTLEAFKGRQLFSQKYESCSKALNECKVVVLTNSEPDMTKLTNDRYDIFDQFTFA